MRQFHPAVAATNAEVMDLLETYKLWGLGLGWIDLHLLASAWLSGAQLWTLDSRLANAATRFAVAYSGFR